MHIVQVVAVGHCFVSACAELDLVDAVMAGDQLVLAGHTTAPALRVAGVRARGRGARVARHATALVRKRAESPRETYVRLALVRAGLPEPSCNVNVGTASAFIGRADLVYPAYRLVIEYDGRQHAQVQRQWESDLDRHDAFSASGWHVLRVTRERIRRPRLVVTRVYEQLRRAGYTGPAPRFDDAWVRMFEATTASRRAAIAMAGSWQ